MADTVKTFDKDSIIGEVVKSGPEASKVIEKYFGNGCFTCAGINVEALSFGCLMHNIDLETVLNELNEVKTT